MHSAAAWPVFISIAWAAGCAPSLAAPEHVQHDAADYVEVPYPPAAALVEVVSERPDVEPNGGKLVWVDGHWTWRGTTYAWQRGGWLIAPEGAHHADWDTFIARDGRIFFAESMWYTEDGQRMDAPKMIVPARTPRNTYTPEFQSAR